MLYFSYNDYLDCEQNGKLNEVQRVGEEIVKYECHSKEEIKENPIIEILKEKNELKKFLIEFLQLNQIIELDDIMYCDKIKTKVDKDHNNFIISKIKSKEIFIIIKEISEIDNNISYKMLEHSINIINKWKCEEQKEKIRNPIVIPVVIYTGEKLWNYNSYRANGKINYIKFKGNSINFSYNLIKTNEINQTELNSMNSKVAQEILKTM